MYGDWQVNHAPFSVEHWKVNPLSLAVHANVLVALYVGSVGFVVMTGAAGATVSTTHAYVAAALELPAASTACTPNVCEPWLSEE